MTILQSMCTSFKAELFTATHDMLTDDIKIALYTDTADLSAATTVYSAAGEVVDSGAYVAGGQSLVGPTVTTAGTQALVSWSTDPYWAATAITARGALIYNSTKGNKAVAVLDFGSDKTSNTDIGFTVVLPPATENNAVIRNA